MSYGHGKDGPLREVVEVLSAWGTKGNTKSYIRKVLLSCGHVIAQVGARKNERVRGYYAPEDIRNLRTHKTARCHICKMKEENNGKL